MRAILIAPRVLRDFVREVIDSVAADYAPPSLGRRYLKWRLVRNLGVQGDELVLRQRARLLAWLADVEKRAGDLAASERAWTQVIEIEPDDWWASIELAMIFEKQGKKRDAGALFLKVADSDLDVPDGIRRRARAEAQRLQAMTRP